MNSLDLLRRLYEHRTWVNHLLLDAAEKLNEEQLRRTFSIGQGTVWRSLMHLYAAEYVWLDALLGNPNATLPGDVPGELPGSQTGEGALTTLAELRKQWQELEGRWSRYLAELTEEDLEHPVAKISTSSGRGRRLTTTRADVLLHLALHAQYTTAQVVNMLRQLGVQPLPDVMLISLARRQQPANHLPESNI